MPKWLLVFAGGAVVLVLLGFLSVAVYQAREAARANDCRNHLKQVVFALHNYHDTYISKFPPTEMDENSWRIRVNPMMVSSAFYSMYRLEEPWDSEWNSTLEFRRIDYDMSPKHRYNKIVPTDDMVKEIDPAATSFAYGWWQCLADSAQKSTHTSYLMLVGPHAFGLANDARSFDEITDGASMTIAVGETTGRDISWLQPKDFDVETMSFAINDPGTRSLASHHSGGPQVGMVDGSVIQLSPELPPELLRAMITINGGEKIIADENTLGGYRSER
ncbi:DUF1559 family PulG-like putative transporter [Bremerella sp. T1]|uniref:DUF1559 family PulG-like putative transporter n=1 Tax=Bremerella sp. TYQ1 TaxID=3119568 RepID=UPI001CCC9D15|nr:DUF1559 domain-containing protein [Bremerella volcania]UBM36449.1 DUF1559 domain-containing protein [Bremerella volcania]